MQALFTLGLAVTRRGGIEYRYGRKELGHVHVLPDTDWVSRWIESDDEAPDVIALFRLSYEWYLKAEKSQQGL